MTISPKSSSNKLVIVLAGVITTAWAVSFLVDIVVKDYDPSASVHALMMLVAGAVFSGEIMNRDSVTQRSKEEKPSNEEKTT